MTAVLDPALKFSFDTCVSSSTPYYSDPPGPEGERKLIGKHLLCMPGLRVRRCKLDVHLNSACGDACSRAEGGADGHPGTCQAKAAKALQHVHPYIMCRCWRSVLRIESGEKVSAELHMLRTKGNLRLAFTKFASD